MGWHSDQKSELKGVFVDRRNGWSLHCHFAHPEHGLQVVRPELASEASLDSMQLSKPTVFIVPSDYVWQADEPLASQTQERLFPLLAESYFRGDDAISLLPQGNDDQFGLNVSYRVLASNEAYLAVETILALQTNLLDSHPTIDLVILGQIADEEDDLDLIAGSSSVVSQTGLRNDALRSTPLPACAYLIRPAEVDSSENRQLWTSVMLPPSDRRAAGIFFRNPDALRIRLLAEFLEKGVIRKTRYWTVTWDHQPSSAELFECYAQLVSEPLPLTP